MMNVMQALEPIETEPNILIVGELDEFTEVLFYMTGSYNIGFTVNRVHKFPLRYGGCRVIGAYNVSYNKRSMFAYKTYERCQGYFVRKSNWLRIMAEEEYQYLVELFKQNAREEYFSTIKSRLLECKEFELRKLSDRADFDTVITLQSVK